jgi:hypothetical protein
VLNDGGPGVRDMAWSSSGGELWVISNNHGGTGGYDIWRRTGTHYEVAAAAVGRLRSLS